MKKNIALLLGLSLSLTAVCALPAAETRAESSKELIMSETPTGSGEMDTTGTEAVTMYRLYNPNSGEHFYTKDASEKNNLAKAGWSDEGIGWIAPEKSDTPVYRLYNANAGDHHYTMNAKERDELVSAGWKSEGIGWYSDDDKTVPLYREYNPNAVTGTHNYTTDKVEHDNLVSLGWNDEGIGWYAIGDGKNDPPKKPDDDSLEIGDGSLILPDRIENGYNIKYCQRYLYDWDFAKLNYLDEFSSDYLLRDEEQLKGNIGKSYSELRTDFNSAHDLYQGLVPDEYLSPGEEGRFVLLRWFKFKEDSDKEGWAVCYVDVVNDSNEKKIKRDCPMTRVFFVIKE